MTDRVLVDTNLWVYLYAKTPQRKHLKIRELVANNFQSIVVSTQILGELYNVLTKKNLRSKEEAKVIILETAINFLILEIDTSKVLQALEINSRYGYSCWDSLVIATAILSNCSLIYSEDMQHNQIVDNKTQIVNPYV